MTTTETTRKITTQELEAFEFLNDLRESGVTNMFGAGSYVSEELAVSMGVGNKLLMLWMKHFDDEGYNENTQIKL